MRPLVLLAFCLPLTTASTVDARLFWQTFGSTIPSGEGCSWNRNQDFFVPRYSTSGRYGLFSPCMTSRSTSPACKACHPLYPGYCNAYGSAHYRWRNHVYKTHCGCASTEACHSPWRNGCCRAAACQEHAVGGQLPNVEPSGISLLGSISAEGEGLLAYIDSMPGEDPEAPEEESISLEPQTITPSQRLPSLGEPQIEELAQPLSSPQPEN